jgi:hypothetical protein
MQRDNTPPHVSPRLPLLFNTPPTVDADFLSWECRMLACRPEGQNDRHILCRQHVDQHVGQHVADMSKKHVGRGPLMLGDMSLADMSADMLADMSVI